MIDFEVPPALEGERIDRAVSLLMEWPRSAVATLIAAGSVQVDGETVAKSHRLAVGERVEVTAEPEPEAPPQPEAMPLTLRHVDEDLVVVAKPAGLVVHPGAGHADGTLVNGLLARFPELAGVGDPMRPGIVHRLDRDTSGLLLVARRAAAHERLVAMLGDHEIDRRYLALVWGRVSAERGTVDAPLGRSARHPMRMTVREDGRPAVTHYTVRERLGATTLLECALETGRTHQIRVHLSSISHPVVGDAAYGGRRGRHSTARPFLHAWSLRLEHPVTRERLSFEEPLPPDLAGALDREREGS